jgi:N-glycosylase/DNA lyase
MKNKFEINSNEYSGPFNLNLTINSGQTSQPAWQLKNEYFQEIISIDGVPCLIKIKQREEDGSLIVVAESNAELELEIIKAKLMEIFGLNDDLNELYKFLMNDPKLEATIDFCRGLRLFKAHDPFECIISSISSANCSIIRWNRSINDIKSKWGQKFRFGSEVFYTFPSPGILQNVPEHDLEEMQRCEENLPDDYIFENNLKSCGVGYRAKYIIKAAEILENQLNINDIHNSSYEDAFNLLLTIPGVGPKVADCILFYGFGFGIAFPVDVWIGRIVSELYFNGEEIKPPKARIFGMEKYGEYSGYVQLYMFHYARKSGLLESLKKNQKK